MPFKNKLKLLDSVKPIMLKTLSKSIIKRTFSRYSSLNSNQLIESSDPALYKCFEDSLIVKEDFISENEEQLLLNEVDPYMKKLRYEFDHWDDAIHGYRETERLNWNNENQIILNRVKQFAFDNFKTNNKNSNLLNQVHVLDLHQDGYIKPHVDSIRFCGNTIAGLSLLSDCVMRLISEKDKSKTVILWLKRRSLYIMRENARYDYAHEVLKNDESYFRNQEVKKTRRISIICRNEPPPLTD